MFTERCVDELVLGTFAENTPILRIAPNRALNEGYALKLVKLLKEFLEEIDSLAMVADLLKR